MNNIKRFVLWADEQLNNNFWVKNVIVPILLVVPIVWFAVPLIGLGIDNIRMIVHFENDEALLINYAAKVYSHGIVPLEFGYPIFFYYLAGLFLWPYTYFRGIDYGLITETFRTMNTVVTVSTALIVYFLCLRFFRSVYVAILSVFLLTFTPLHLWWANNARPHPLEIFFIFASFYFCFLLIEEYKPKYMRGALLFAGLAAATKYGGIFLIPVVWLTYIHHLFSSPDAMIIKNIKEKYALINIIASLIMFFIAAIFISGAFVILKYPQLFVRNSFNGAQEFLRIRDVRIIIILLGLLFLAGLGWLLINILSKRLLSKSELVQRDRSLFIADLGGLFLLYIIGVVGIIFAVLNPAFWLFPIVSIKAVANHFVMTTMGSAVTDLGINSPIIDVNRLVWFRMIFDNMLLGRWLGFCFFFYLVYEVVSLKTNWLKDKTFVLQRALLWVYMLALFLMLFIFVSHRPHHYLLPICIAMMVLISFGIVQIIKSDYRKSLKIIFSAVIIILISLSCYDRGKEIIHDRKLKLGKINDTGIYIGNWLKNEFPENIVIWKDSDIFYIPPKFSNVSCPVNGVIDLVAIKKLDPSLLVLTSPLNKKQIIGYFNRGGYGRYKEIRKFKYSNVYFDYKTIYIYKNTNQPRWVK